MSLSPVTSRTTRARLLNGPLSQVVPRYVAKLKRSRYSTQSAQSHLGVLGHFAQWLSMCHLPIHVVDEECVDFFLRHHLPFCDCASPADRIPCNVHAALTPLLAILRETHVIPAIPEPTGPIAEELKRYNAYMQNARGLASGTRRGYLRTIGRFLLAKFAGRPVLISKLKPADIHSFINDQLDAIDTTSNAAKISSALRAYMGYRTICGDAVLPLLAAIATPAHWGLATLPRGLTPEEVDRLLKSFTDATPSRRRGYAVVRLGLDLGLRSIEINRLELDDIDWKRGSITLKRTKSLRQDVMPLPIETGKALEAYVLKERPKTNQRMVFVRHVAPYDQPLGVDGIRAAVRDVFRRAGIPHSRSHSLRHTLACRLINRGSSIKEVADILRHRSLNTALIYAKVNQSALAEVALPWPGSSS
jgi:integrase/recombinase XerC